MNNRKNKKNKNNQSNKNKNTPIYRNIDERREEINKIINNLNTYKLNLEFDAIKELYSLFKKYIDTGERILINIAFPIMNKRIEGVLAINKNEEVAIRLKYEKF